MHYVADSTIHNEFMGSDHCPIQLKLDLTGYSSRVPSSLTNTPVKSLNIECERPGSHQSDGSGEAHIDSK